MKLTKTTFLLGCAVGGMTAAVSPLLLTDSRAETRLLPFQGRLTDAAGAAIPDGAKVVEFKMYDAPIGGAVKWAGEIHKLSVNGGLVNTTLGSKATLGSVDFSTSTYLQITVDANNDNQINAADPPLLPRQSVIAAVYASEAGNSRHLGAYPAAAYQSVFANADPSSGQLEGSKIKPLTLSGAALSAESITSAQIASGEVKTSELADNSVTTSKIVDGEVRTEDLAPGSVTQSKLEAANFVFSPFVNKTAAVGTEVAIATVEITTNGRPVEIGLMGGSSDSIVGIASMTSDSGSGSILFYQSSTLSDRGTRFSEQGFGLEPGSGTTDAGVDYPPSSFRAIIHPAAGRYFYRVAISSVANTFATRARNVQVYAREW